MMKSTTGKITLGIGILLVVGFLFRSSLWGAYIDTTMGHLLDTPVSEQRKNTSFTIAPGSSVGAIANQLSQAGLIQSDELFVRYVEKNNLSSLLQSGKFILSPNMTTPTIVGYLTGSITPDQVSITIPEGYTVRELAAFLEEKGLASEKETLACVDGDCDFSAFTFLPTQTADMHFQHSYLEGYLFPDTYYIDKDTFQVEGLLDRMLENFRQRVVLGLANQLADSKYTLSEIIIMASILEKESRPRDGRDVVAGLLWKRIENNVQLATDATNRYIKDNPKDDIYMKELLSSNPYNTRKQKGLTPSAISNPGLSSITAAFTPKDSPYWYYLHAGDGQIYFSSTEAEHERTKNTYLR